MDLSIGGFRGILPLACEAANRLPPAFPKPAVTFINTKQGARGELTGDLSST